MPADSTSAPAFGDAGCAYCDVSLPVPLDQFFTYSLPETLRHRVRTGCRVLAPFGSRKLSGVVLRTHDDPPMGAVKEILRLLDEEPVLDADLLKLGQWIAGYYCAPLGETLRAMTPLAGEMRRGKIYSLTPTGRDVARQLHLGDAADDDEKSHILRMLDARSLTASSLTRKFSKAAAILRSLEKNGFVEAEDVAAERDPLRASAARLRVEFIRRMTEELRAGKLPKPQRELLSYLELHPGSHNVAEIEKLVPKASVAARALARNDLVRLTVEAVHSANGPVRAPHRLNPHQQAAVDQVREALDGEPFSDILVRRRHGLRQNGSLFASHRSDVGARPRSTHAGSRNRSDARGRRTISSAFRGTRGDVALRVSRFRTRAGMAAHPLGRGVGGGRDALRRVLPGSQSRPDSGGRGARSKLQAAGNAALSRPRRRGDARDAGAVVILGSATPSLETRYNASTGKYIRLPLPERIEKRPMPKVTLIDMRQEFLETRKQDTFSRALVEAVDERLKNGEQTMLLLNRRGFSSFVACRACGERVQCANCTVTLTFHRRDRRMLCHYCNYSERVPEHCPKCGSDYIQFLGLGSERLEEELHGAFPKARIARLDRDSVRGKHDYETVLSAFRAGDYDVLVGTQMIAKGHDIPNVTLVGIVNADIGLGLPDFRAAERTFQLLTQAAGRAGRGETPGIVLIQTINPDHYAIRCAAAQDYEAFYQKEIEFRHSMLYPPFSSLANVIVRGTKEEEALSRSAALGRLLQPAPEGIRVLGPAAAAVARLKNEYRYQMLVKASTRKRLAVVLAELRRYAQSEKWNPASLVIDVDPLTLM